MVLFVCPCNLLPVLFVWPDTSQSDLYGRSFTSSPKPFSSRTFLGFEPKLVFFFCNHPQVSPQSQTIPLISLHWHVGGRICCKKRPRCAMEWFGWAQRSQRSLWTLNSVCSVGRAKKISFNNFVQKSNWSAAVHKMYSSSSSKIYSSSSSRLSRVTLPSNLVQSRVILEWSDTASASGMCFFLYTLDIGHTGVSSGKVSLSIWSIIWSSTMKRWGDRLKLVLFGLLDWTL